MSLRNGSARLITVSQEKIIKKCDREVMKNMPPKTFEQFPVEGMVVPSSLKSVGRSV